MNVRFFAGSRADYDSLPSPRNPLGLYFCADTHELFWGDKLISDGVRVIPTRADLPEFSKAADGVVYYVTQTRNGYTLSPDRTQWLQTIYAPVTDAYKVPESEIYNTVTTVGAVRDIEAKIYKTIDEKFIIPDVDLSNYYNKSETVAVIKEAIEEIELPTAPDTSDMATQTWVTEQGYLTEHQSLDAYAKKEELFSKDYNDLINVPEIPSIDGLATEKYVDDTIAAISKTDLSNYYNKTEVAEAIASATSEKADKVLFNTDKFVNNPIGGFSSGDNIKDLTVAELVTRLLGLTDTFGGENPDDPEVPKKVTIEVAKQKSIPVLQGGVKTSDGSTTVDDNKSIFAYVEISEEQKSAAPQAADPGTSAIYEIINNSGEVVEHGYLVYTIASGRGTYWRVSLAEGLVIKEIKMFDDLQGQWIEYTPTLVDTGERLEVDGYTYVVYQSSDRSNGEILRFIIE
jgi:hypothetical protein